MITAALNGNLIDVDFENHPIFGVAIPQSCPNVPTEILNPRNTWTDKALYDTKALELGQKFKANFAKFEEFANDEILAGGPLV